MTNSRFLHRIKSIVFGLLCLALIAGCDAEEEILDNVVIGGGLMGSATAWQLSKAGEKVVLFEKQGELYESGSSLGEARIARSLGPKGDMWSYLHNRTVEEARQLVAFLKAADPAGNHEMNDIYRTSPVSYVRHKNRLERVRKMLVEQVDSFQFADQAAEAKQLFDANLSDSIFLLREYKLYSGTINPSALIRKLHRAVTLKGGSIRYHTIIRSLRRNGAWYEVEIEDTQTGERKTLKSRRIVAAAGPYNGDLLKDTAPYFGELINPQRVFLAFFRIAEEVYQTLSPSDQEKLKRSYPVINSTAGTREGSNFSMIESFSDTGNPLIKIGGHFQRSAIDNLDEVWKKEVDEAEQQWAKRHILRYFEIVGLPVSEEALQFELGYSCVYSLSQNEVPYVTLIPEGEEHNPDFLVLGAMSGVGAKGSLAYGLLGAHQLLGVGEEDPAYVAARKALGIERLKRDIAELAK